MRRRHQRARNAWLAAAAGVLLACAHSGCDARPVGGDVEAALLFLRDDDAGTRQLFSATADGDVVFQLTRAAQVPAGVVDAAWSPDGASIVFTDGATLYQMSARGADLHAIALDGQTARIDALSVSPDASWLLFEARLDGAATTQLVRVRPSGADVRVIPDSRGLRAPAWSPSGDHVVAHTSGVRLLYRVAIDDGSRQRLATIEQQQLFSPAAPAWSPSGRIAFSARRGTRRIIASVDAGDGGDLRVHGARPSDAYSPAFDAAGAKLLASVVAPGATTLDTIEIDLVSGVERTVLVNAARAKPRPQQR